MAHGDVETNLSVCRVAEKFFNDLVDTEIMVEEGSAIDREVVTITAAMRIA